MAILSRLLNKTVDVKRPDKIYNAVGDTAGVLTTVESSIKCRITRNKFIGQDTINEAGRISAATHRIFMDTGLDIKTGDYVVDGNDKYWVDSVNIIPGGEIDHHIECACIKTSI